MVATLEKNDNVPQWQCVMVLWGTKYSVALVNHQFRAVQRHTSRTARFLLVTDRAREGLDPGIEAVDFDPFFLNERFLGPGCQAKLALFSRGTIPTDLPAVYIDLDTVVLGDLSRLVDHLDRPERIRILPSATLPFGPVGRVCAKLTNGRRYPRGNSSVMLWQPGCADYVAERFKSLYALYPDLSFRPMIADERFISWVAQPYVRRIPADLGMKFPNDFMHPWAFWLKAKSRLPWVKRRRGRLAAVTFPSPELKPGNLYALGDGDLLRDRKGRVMIWSDDVLGPLRQEYIEYYATRPDIREREHPERPVL